MEKRTSQFQRLIDPIKSEKFAQKNELTENIPWSGISQIFLQFVICVPANYLRDNNLLLH